MNTNYRPSDGMDSWEAENVFYLKSSPARLAKLMAHYELYRKIIAVPGAVVECGVYKGASIMRFATFRMIMENDHARAIIGFDAFGKFPEANVAGEADLSFINRFESAGGHGISRDKLQQLLQQKGFGNVMLEQGNVFETVPAFLRDNPHLRIALLHLDMDVYEPTKFCLDAFCEAHMAPGGLVVFDDYNAVSGATTAADEFARARGLALQKAPYYNVPSFIEWS